MDDPGRVRGREPPRDRRRDAQHLGSREGPGSRDERSEGLAVDELHGQEVVVAVVSDVERPRHVGAGDAAREPHLLPEALEHPRHRRELAPEELERDDLVELDVVGLVDCTHSSGPEERDDLVAAGEHGVRGAEVRGALRRGGDEGVVLQQGRGLRVDPVHLWRIPACGRSTAR